MCDDTEWWAVCPRSYDITNKIRGAMARVLETTAKGVNGVSSFQTVLEAVPSNNTTFADFTITPNITMGAVTTTGATTKASFTPGEYTNFFYYWVKRTAGAASGENATLNYTYYIYKDGSLMAQTTSHNSTSAIASLKSSLAAAGINVTTQGSVLRVISEPGVKWTGSDSWGDQASESWQGKVKKLQDLPNKLGFERATIEITGDETSGFDNYYVKYMDNAYIETVIPGKYGTLAPCTMPHAIIRGQDSSEDIKFYITPIDRTELTPFEGENGTVLLEESWGKRKVGDVDSAPEPSFVGKTISDVFFYKNRLGILAGDNVCLSETGAYYNFFPTTITDVLDSDPIDVSVDSNHAVYLSYALPFNKELLIFGNKAQFTLSASKALSPKDVNIQESTSYSINNKVAPMAIGPNVFFATDRNNSSIIREYFVVPDTSNNTAANITAHVPSYLPPGLIKMAGSEKHDMLFAIDGKSNKIYVYNFYWQGEEKAQSAWHTWKIGASDDPEEVCIVFNVEVLGSNLLIMLEDSTQTKKLANINLELTTDISTLVYKDTDTLDIESRIEMSKWGIPSGQSNVDSNRSSLIIRDLQLSMGENSTYGVELTRAGVTKTWYNYNDTTPELGDHKYTVVGNANNVQIALVSDTDKGFKLNSLSWRGQMHLKGSRGI